MKKRSLVVAFDRRHVGCLSPVLASAIAGAEEVARSAPDPTAVAPFITSFISDLNACLAGVEAAIAAEERQAQRVAKAKTKVKRG